MAGPNYHVEKIEFAKLRDLVQIGEGGFGEVYWAKHCDWGPVAFKRLLVTFIKEHERAATELQREVAIHSKLQHNNIIRLMGVVFEPQNYGVILEYATHGDLWYFIRTFHPVPWAWKLFMASGIALGMNYLHTARERPLIHGDLKMKNVLISDGFKPKISDFGLSRWKRYSYEMTRRDRPGGTVTHIPPENWRDINTSPTEKYDVYSFGILLWELLSEQHPFDTADTNTIKDAVLDGRRPQLLFIPAEVPDFLKQVINNCWAQNPQDRPLFSVLKPQLEGYVDLHRGDIQVAKQQLQQRESHRSAVGERHRVPAPNVPTRNQAVAVDDPGSMRLPYSVVDSGLSHAGRSRVAYQPGVRLHSDVHVRTNQGFAVNVQPESADLSSMDVSHASGRSVDLHPSDPDQSDRSVGLQMERMELSSGEVVAHPAAVPQPPADEAMDQ